MARRATDPLDAVTAAGHVVAHLAAARETGDRVAIPRSFRDVGIEIVRRWPPWVARAAVLKSRSTWWLWCEPRRGPRGAGQFVMDVPDGRYFVDVMDTRTHAWCSRESAAGGPLVAGLPATGGALIARVTRVAEPGRTREDGRE
jgi:hypothetical protein